MTGSIKTGTLIASCALALVTAGDAIGQTTFSHDDTIAITVSGGGGDLLSEGPAPAAPGIAISATTIGLVAGDHINSLSFGNDPIAHTHQLVFSVDSNATGAVASGVNLEVVKDTDPCARGAIPPGACGDIFFHITGTTSACTNITAPRGLGYRPPIGAPSGDECNASWNNVASPNTPGGPADDLNAFDYSAPASATGIYFTLTAGSPTLGTLGASPGHILYSDLSGGAPVVATLAGVGPATDAELGIAGRTLDALNVIGSDGPVGGVPPGGVISAYGVGPVLCGTGATSTHRLQYSVAGSGPPDGGDILVRTGSGTAAVYVGFADMGLLQTDELNMLEAVRNPIAPAASEWGVGVTSLLVVIAATLAIRGRRARTLIPG